MVRTIIGRAGAGKTALVFREIAEYVRQGVGKTVLLVPEQYSHEAERELCAAAGDTMSRYGEVLSFTGLARKVFAQAGGEKPAMDGAGRLLCMAVAAQGLEGQLRVYHRGRQEPRTLDSLTRAMEELKNAGVSPAELAAAAEHTQGALSDKLRDLGLLMEAYTAVESLSGADSADRLSSLAALLGDSDVSGRYYADGFSDFTALEKEVLRQIVRAGADLTVCLTCDESREGASLLPLATARWLRTVAGEYGAEYSEQRVEPAGPVTPIRYYCDHLFDFGAPAYEGGTDAVRCVRAGDISQECELAAARMAELARGGCRWRDMAVAARGFGDYRTALESACARYGVPLFLSGRGDTLQKSLPLALSCALEAVCRGYEYEAVFGYLKTGLGPISLEDTDILENYALLWGVRGRQWDRPWTMHPEGYNREMDDRAKETLDKLNALRQAVITPLKALEERTSKAAAAREQAMALAAFLEDTKLAERLEARTAELAALGRPEAAAEQARLWDILCGALEQFAAVLGDMAMDVQQFQGLFTLMLSKYDVNVIPVSLDRVSAGEIDAMRRRHTRHLILLGAADGRIPAPEAAGGVFTPDEREELAALGLDVGSAEEDLGRELGRIYSCLTLPSESLILSWPAVDAAGEDQRPGLLISRAKDLLGVTPIQGDVLRARTFAAGPAFSLALRGWRGEAEPLCLAARDYFATQGRKADLDRLAQAARAVPGPLGPGAVRDLYGPEPRMSPTRAEKFAGCRFSYFLQYGLRAKPRVKEVFAARDYGTFMHYILENVARSVLDEGGFAAVDEKRLTALTDQWVEKYIADEMGGFADRTARFAYLFRRLRATVRRVVKDMWEELKDSKFQPIDLELDLAAGGAPAPGEPVLSGRADRVDGWVQGDTLYLRITDYKTGVKHFDLSDVCMGLNLQMLLYLFALERHGQERFGVKEICPAGVLYSMAKFEITDAAGDVTDEELEKLRRAAGKNYTRRSGLLLDDETVLQAMEPEMGRRFLPVKITKNGVAAAADGTLASLERFGALNRYIDDTLANLAAELKAGSVTQDPWYRDGSENACRWCDFKEACRFEETGGTWRMRTKLDTEDAWKRIEGHE